MNELAPPLSPIDPSQPDAPPPPLRREAKAYRVVFRGQAAEYFKIWIVNVALTVVTFGIYGAWARVRTRQYFFGNTFVDNHPFAYLARPTALLRGMLIVAAASGAYYLTSAYAPPEYAFLLIFGYALAVPAIVVMALRFRTHYTAYRGLRFGFVGGFGEAYKAFLLWPILSIIPFLIPVARQRQARFVFGNLRYGSTRSHFSAESGPYFQIYLAALGLGFLLFLVMGVLVGGLGAFDTMAQGVELSGEPAEPSWVVMVPVMVVYAAGLVFLEAFLEVRKANLALSSTGFDQLQLVSEMRVRDMAWLYITNALAIIGSLGLAIPWAKTRIWAYRCDHMSLVGTGELDEFVAAQDNQLTSAAADAAIDFGLEF